jgi:hypothetical protein
MGMPPLRRVIAKPREGEFELPGVGAMLYNKTTMPDDISLFEFQNDETIIVE